MAFDLARQEGLDPASISTQRRDTWLLDTPVPPIALTRSSTARVEMPCT